MYTLSAFSPLSSYAKNPLFQNSVEDQTAARTNGTSTVDRCCNRGSVVEASVFQPEGSPSANASVALHRWQISSRRNYYRCHGRWLTHL